MKKTRKSNQPDALIMFSEINPSASWDDFRHSNQGHDYKQTRLTGIQDQGGLCAYCEVHYSDKPETFSIEHFHPKSDKSDPAKNWALDWDNMHAVCRGGRDKNNDGQQPYPTPENLSCDAYKDHLVTRGRLTEDCEEWLFNPLHMPAANLFKFDRSNGRLIVNEDACAKIENANYGAYADLIQLATQTLRILNLNCQRLCDMRLEVLKNYNQLIKKAREQNNRAIHQQLAQRWFSTAWPKYFTTRRALLGKSAEQYLEDIQYNG